MNTVVFTFQDIKGQKFNSYATIIHVENEEQIRHRLLYRYEYEYIHYFVIKNDKIYLKNLQKSYDKFEEIKNIEQLNFITEQLAKGKRDLNI